MEFIIVAGFIGMVIGLIWLVRQGGIAGLIARSRVKNELGKGSAPTASAPGYLSETTSPTPHGANQSERLADIDQYYANDLNPVEVGLSAAIPAIIPVKSIAAAARDMSERLAKSFREVKDSGALGGMLHGANQAYHESLAEGALRAAVLRRTLRDLGDTERALLRLADTLLSLGQLSAADHLKAKIPIIWNNGSCLLTTIEAYNRADLRVALVDGLKTVIGGHFGDVATSSEILQGALRTALAPQSTLAAAERGVLEGYLFAGSRWLAPGEAVTTASPYALSLGLFEGTQQDLLYDRRESLITIAPPGSGKSQAHVLRNLLRLRGPAIVLDIKGEAFRATAQWRQQNVGRLFAFAPTMPSGSMHYNPLDAVSQDPAVAWDDARRLADLLVVPQDSDPYFENRARDFLTVALLDVALTEPAEYRNINAVLDRLYLSEENFLQWLTHLEGTGVIQLARQAAAWRVMPEKQREGIFDSARKHLEVWQSPTLAPLIDRSDWTAEQIRAENGTLYLCVELGDVKKFAGVLRVLIGQAVDQLCRGEPETNAPIVTLFLDELPRLRRMDVIEEALDVGRGYGVRLWMFCQNIGQLRSAYPNADGMVGNCAARCYMDPDDETAEDLSRYLGQRKGLIDGRQKPLADPTELKGPGFADKIVVFMRGRPPAKLIRTLAVQDAASQARMRASA